MNTEKRSVGLVVAEYVDISSFPSFQVFDSKAGIELVASEARPSWMPGVVSASLDDGRCRGGHQTVVAN